MDTCRKTLLHTDCAGGTLENQHTTVYDPFEVCLPFGRKIVYDGQGLRLEGRVTLRDGKYGIITVTDGCIVDASEQPVCEYTAQPCTPAASPCGNNGTSSGIELQPGADNLMHFDASGRVAATLNYSTDTDGLSIRGNGTVASPLVIDYVPKKAEKVYIRSVTPNTISVAGEGTGTEPYTVAHVDSRLTAGDYGEFTIDSCGHIIGYTKQDTSITAIQAVDGITATKTGTSYSIGLSRYNSDGNYMLGGFTVSIDGNGRISGIAKSISLPVDSMGVVILDPSRNNLAFNEFGALVSYVAKTDRASDSFAEVLYPNRTESKITINTTKEGYLKISYKGWLPAEDPNKSIELPETDTGDTGTEQPEAPIVEKTRGYYALPGNYSVTIEGRKTTAYARYSKEAEGIVEVIAVSEALYSATSLTVALTCSDNDFTFTDGAVISVDLIAR